MISRPALLLLIFSQIILLLFLWQIFGPTQKEKTSTEIVQSVPAEQQESAPLPDSWVGRPLPDVSLQTSSGKINLASFKGTPLVVEFISTSCPYCQKMAPIFDKVMRSAPADFLVVGVGGDNLKSMRRWHEKKLGKKMPGTWAVDNKGEAVEKLGLVGTPTTVFVNRQGEVRSFLAGEFSEEEMIQLIKDAAS